MARAMPGPAPPPKAKAVVASTEDRAATKKGDVHTKRAVGSTKAAKRGRRNRTKSGSAPARGVDAPSQRTTTMRNRDGARHPKGDRPTHAPGPGFRGAAKGKQHSPRDAGRWKKKSPEACSAQPRGYEKKLRQRPTLPQRHRCSTIGSEELNFRVRDGIGWNLFDITTGKLWIASQPEFRDRAHLPRETRRGW